MIDKQSQSVELGVLYGHLTMHVYDVKNGKRERLYTVTKRNQITNLGRYVLLECLAGEAEVLNNQNTIWSLSIGTGGTPAAAEQTQLITPVWSGGLTPGSELVYSPSNFEVNIIKEVPAGQADEQVIAEAGLFTRGEYDDEVAAGVGTWEEIPGRRMYARQTVPSFTKSASMSVTFDWKLGLTVQA